MLNQADVNGVVFFGVIAVVAIVGIVLLQVVKPSDKSVKPGQLFRSIGMRWLLWMTGIVVCTFLFIFVAQKIFDVQLYTGNNPVGCYLFGCSK